MNHDWANCSDPGCGVTYREDGNGCPVCRLTAENTALTARVEALEDLYRFGPHGRCSFCGSNGEHQHDCKLAIALTTGPITDLSAHDEAVRREVVEKIALAGLIEPGETVGLIHYPSISSIYRAAGIPPSTDTEGE